MVGVDAPELSRDGSAAECWAVQARDRLNELAPAGTMITVRRVAGQPDRDVYGRMLRTVLIDGADVGHRLVADGAALS